MPKEKQSRHVKKPGLTDAELIAKYGSLEPQIPFESMIGILLSKPNPNVPVKTARRLSISE